MQSDIVVALIVSAFSMTGTVVGTRLGIREANKLTVYRISQLEKKVDKHNNLVERMTGVEKTITADKDLNTEKFKVVNHRLEDLEEGKGVKVARAYPLTV